MVPSSDSIRKAGQINDFVVVCVDECSNLWEDVDSVPLAWANFPSPRTPFPLARSWHRDEHATT